MFMASNPYGPRRRRLLIGLTTLSLTLAAIGIWLVFSDTGATPSPPPSKGTVAPPQAQLDESSDTTQPAHLDRIEQTSDPEDFAESVAQALFTWDTGTPIPLADYSGRLVAVADPTGQESPGLVADITGYLPNEDAWTQLREYYTRQWIEISSITVPDKWDQALAEAGGDLTPGTTAYTIRGTRHRSGIWEGDSVESAHEVAFTVFIVCGPTYNACHLLRLSRIDEPLE